MKAALLLTATVLLLLCTANAQEVTTHPHTFTEAITEFWDEDIKPTLSNSLDRRGKTILASGVATSILAFQYDDQIMRRYQTEANRPLSNQDADFLGWIGNGSFGIGIALGQLYFDTSNGIQHSKAIALTAASHITIAVIAQRQRPNGQNSLSFPSGHASSAFATATSLAYSYGYKAGLPAYLAASLISFARVNQNIHYLSDTVAGAAIGIFWGSASANNTKRAPYQWMPFYNGGSTGLQVSMEF